MMTSREPPVVAVWTRLPTVADVRKRVRDRRDDVSAVADDVIAVWRACGCGVRNGRERAEARVASLLEEGDGGAELLDLAQDLEDEQPHFNAVFYADQRRDRCIEVVDGGRAFLVGGRFRVENEDPGTATWSLGAQLRLAMAHIEFLREVKTGLEVGRARLEEALAELRTRRDRALRRVADILIVIEEAAEGEEAEIDLGKMLASVDAALREEVEEIEVKIRDTLPAVTKMTRKSKKVSNVRETTQEQRDGSFLCPYCGKSFTLANSFSAHLSDHGGRRRRNRLTCQTCGRGFSDAVALASHRSAAHHAEKGGVNDCWIEFLRIWG